MWKMERDMEVDACKWEEEKRQEENAFKTFTIVIMLL